MIAVRIVYVLIMNCIFLLSWPAEAKGI